MQPATPQAACQVNVSLLCARGQLIRTLVQEDPTVRFFPLAPVVRPLNPSPAKASHSPCVPCSRSSSRLLPLVDPIRDALLDVVRIHRHTHDHPSWKTAQGFGHCSEFHCAVQSPVEVPPVFVNIFLCLIIAPHHAGPGFGRTPRSDI
jgi:hypothetical protein